MNTRAAAAVLAGAGAVACSSSAPDDSSAEADGASTPALPRVALVTDRYADDADCVRCHRPEARGYERSGMSRTWAPPTPEIMIEDWDDAHFLHQRSDRHYEMFRNDDGAYTIRRYQLDAEGRRYNEMTETVDWVIGSGAHSRTYVYRNTAGELHQFPVAWYADDGAWGMHGGFDSAVHEGFERRITRDCFACHNAYFDLPVSEDKLGWPNLFPDDLPHGIGCQRCHGAGAEHVRLADDMSTPDDAVYASIINPPALPAPLGEDICLQCHLLPASRLGSRVPRFGRGHLSFEAGEPLANHVVHFAIGDEVAQRERFEANHHPYRLRQSRCWTESEGALTCFSCHRVHARPEPAERATWYRDRCLDCHEPHDPVTSDLLPAYLRAAAPDDCVACHMPRRRASDLIGEVVHDHAIQRHAPADDPTRHFPEQAAAAGEPVVYMPDRAPPEAELALQRAIVRVRGGLPGALDELLALVDEHEPAAIEPYAHLGPSMAAAGRPDEAERLLRAALGLDEALPVAHLELGRLLVAQGRLDEAQRHLARAVELEPRLPEAYIGLAAVAAQQGRIADATRHMEVAVTLRPIDATAYRMLTSLYTGLGDAPRAAQAAARLLAVAPHETDAYLQLGLALMYAGRLDDAERWFARGASRVPGDPRLAEGRAAALALAGRFDDALFVVDAVRQRPGADEIACLLVEALAYRGLERHEAALAARNAAFQTPPAPGDSPVLRLLRDAVMQLPPGS